MNINFRKGSQGLTWSEPTIRKAAKLKDACGKYGYELLLDEGYPLPCVKTLQTRLKSITYDPQPGVPKHPSTNIKSDQGYLLSCMQTLRTQVLGSTRESETRVIRPFVQCKHSWPLSCLNHYLLHT